MRLLLIVLLTTLLPLAALATGSDHHNTTTNNTNVAASQSSADADARSNSDASSKSSAEVDSHDTYEAAASSASIYLEGCNQGAAAQGVGFGVALGGESRVCQLLRVAEAARSFGQLHEANRAVRQAFIEAGVYPDEQPPLARATRWLRRNISEPLVDWIPFVGQGA